MLHSTTPTVEGRRITEYHDVVVGEAIIGANIFRDFFAGIRDIVGGRAGSYEKALRGARETAFEDMDKVAKELGANAIVGIDIDYENISMKDGGGMLMVSVTGTAVTME